jgi:hypothetical protein
VQKPNYHQARKQKELARKARQQQKQERRAVREPDENTPTPSAAEAAAPRDPTVGNGT